MYTNYSFSYKSYNYQYFYNVHISVQFYYPYSEALPNLCTAGSHLQRPLGANAIAVFTALNVSDVRIAY